MLNHGAQVDIPSRQPRYHPHPIGYEARRYDALDLAEFGACDDGTLFWLQRHHCEPLERADWESQTWRATAGRARVRTRLLASVADGLIAVGQWLKAWAEPALVSWQE